MFEPIERDFFETDLSDEIEEERKERADFECEMLDIRQGIGFSSREDEE